MIWPFSCKYFVLTSGKIGERIHYCCMKSKQVKTKIRKTTVPLTINIVATMKSKKIVVEKFKTREDLPTSSLHPASG